jgi:hypothetical protein
MTKLLALSSFISSVDFIGETKLQIKAIFPAICINKEKKVCLMSGLFAYF